MDAARSWGRIGVPAGSEQGVRCPVARIPGCGPSSCCSGGGPGRRCPPRPCSCPGSSARVWPPARRRTCRARCPTELAESTLAGNTVVLAADGTLITYFYRNNRTPVADRPDRPGDEAGARRHRGLPVLRPPGPRRRRHPPRPRAATSPPARVVEGGSTITQQLVKQSLLQAAATAEERAAATEESVGRKLREARLALALEQQSTKAAAPHPLPASVLRPRRLRHPGRGPAVLQRGRRRPDAAPGGDAGRPRADAGGGRPDHQSGGALERRNQVLQRMHAWATSPTGSWPDLRVAGRGDPLPAAAERLRGRPVAGFFCDFLQRYLTQTLGISQERLENGGLTITTTLRPAHAGRG